MPYRLHLFEVSIRGQNSKGEQQTLHGELVAVREELSGPTTGAGRFSMVPADCLLDLPPHPEPPAALAVFDSTAAADYIKVTFQMQLRGRCQEERRHFVDICRDYLTRSFEARIRAVPGPGDGPADARGIQPEVAIARQRAENELTDIERTRKRTARRAGPAHPRQARPRSARRHGAGATRRCWVAASAVRRKTSTRISAADPNWPQKT